MSVPTALALLVLCTVKVQCVQESSACPRKESHPGVLALNVGSEVILGCRGDVTVDSVPLVMGTKHKEELKRRGPVTSNWRPQKVGDSPGTTETHQPEPENGTTTGTYKMNTATGTYNKVSKSVTTDNPVTNTTKEQMEGIGKVLQAVNEFTKPSSVGGVTEEGAFSVNMEMGLSTDRSTEDEEDEEYEDQVEGLRVTRSIKRQAQWMRNNQLIRDGVEHGGAFRIPALRLNDSGNYSCYRGGKLVSSVKISAGIPPLSPNLSCYKKSHTSKIRCEWISTQIIIPHPQCYLLHRKGLEKISLVSCSYSAKASRCWCVLPSEEGGRNLFTAKLCVTNTAGNVTSSPYSYIPQNIIKPDPPTIVAVNPVKFEPHTLKVSWSLPATWKQSFFYILKFQLRYHPKHSKQYQSADAKYDTELLWLISDALPNVEYEVRMRAKDEYDGQWSDWSRPMYARTWTASVTDPPDVNTSVEAFWLLPEGSGGSEVEEVIRPADDGDGVMWDNMLWVLGFSLLILFSVFFVYVVRRRMPFMSKKSKERVSSISSCHSAHFQQPLIALRSSGHEKEGEVIHLHNVDYFLPNCESYRS